MLYCSVIVLFVGIGYVQIRGHCGLIARGYGYYFPLFLPPPPPLQGRVLTLPSKHASVLDFSDKRKRIQAVTERGNQFR